MGHIFLIVLFFLFFTQLLFSFILIQEEFSHGKLESVEAINQSLAS
jgi:hypothetical protein